MPLIGVRDLEALPSVWAEARSTMTLHNERTNVPRIITRSEADAISNNAAGPVRRTTHQAIHTATSDPAQARYENGRHPEMSRWNYSPQAWNQQGLYHPYDYFSYNYNVTGRETFAPPPNPVIVDKII
ncbi:MAG: hypothetical protein LBP33_01325 [Candidatus Adiutrix sp.]|jgi:hypothetical protein|nr:hypothetical protein [Candidatus Adiutrix sp.]